MNKLKIWINAISHYNRMIAWAENQKNTRSKSDKYMVAEIGEYWQGVHCPYCDEYYRGGVCFPCPLGNTYRCCEDLWCEMNRSYTWGKWVMNAKRVRMYIIRNGLK